MENTNMKSRKKNIIMGAVTGFATGIIWELFIITPLMSDWTLRSIIVALTVSGIGCSFAGMLFGAAKDKKENRSEETTAEVL